MPVPATRTRSRPLLETLEPRILYSADLAAVMGAVGTAEAGGAEAGLVQEQRLQVTATALATLTTTAAAEIAFVDLSVPDAGTLLGGLLAQRAQGRLIEVVTFASDEDGLARLGQTLAERQAEGARFDAVHVFSHGSAGALQLGSATLDADSLLRRAGEIAGWGGALSAQADLLLYGCDVADGADGLFLIEGLAALTGADVAASDDTTGSAARGGDWLLEQHTGQIEASLALDAGTQAAWVGALGSEQLVNLTTAGVQTTLAETRGSQQAVTLDGAGNYTVVWTSHGQDGGGHGVYARRFAFDGQALTGEIRVNATIPGHQQNARIVGDSAGNFAVVWTSQHQDGTTASVYFRRFAANGTALTGEIRANASDTGDQLNAVIGMNGSNGDVVVAWEGDGPGGQSVFFRRFAQDGTALDATDRAAGTFDSERNPAVAMDATGRFVVVWNEGSHLYFQRYDASGAAAGGITQADNNLSNSVGPTVAMNDQGRFVIAYREQDTIPGIWGRTYNADGSPRAFWFNADTGDATSPSVSMAADGSAVVVYQKTGDGDGMGIYARKISAAGFVQGTPFLVNQSTAKEQVAASVAVRSIDQFVVAWSGDSAADNDGVYARTFEPANTAPLITTNGGTSTAAVSVAENTTAVTTVGASDADWPIQTVQYAIVGGADQARFAIDSTSGALRFVAAPDFERPADAGGDNVYEVTVQASDLLLSSNTQTLTVTVTDLADQVAAVADTASTPYASAVTVDVLANDQLGTGGSALALLEVSPPAHGKATVVGGQVVYTPDAGFVGTETVHYRIIDGSEGLALYAALDDNIGSLAGEPSPTAGQFGQALQFDGVDDRLGLAGVTYTPGFTLSYWFKLASNSGTGYQYLYSHGTVSTQNSLNAYFIQDATATASGVRNVLRTALVDGNDATATANLAALDIPVAGLADNRWHQYTLTTKTGAGSAVYIDGTLRASSLTQGGDAIAPSGAVYLGSRIDLASDRFLTGALDDVALYHRTTPAAAVATQYSNTGPGTTGTLTVTVTPVNTETPVIASDGGGPVGTPTVAENTTAVTTVTATDADVGGPALTYSIVGGADQALFSLDSASGVLSFRAAPDAESPTDTDRDNVYDVEVQASDGVHTDTQALKIQVTDTNEHAVTPIVDGDSAPDEVDEHATVGTTVGLTAQATDADRSLNTVTYTLTDTAGGRFAIDAVSGVVTVTGLLDAEAATAHRITVLATSADGSSQTLQFVLTVRDLDEFDVTTPADADPAVDSVAETAPVGSSVGLTVAAVDADLGNNGITYSLLDDAEGRFTIGPSSGVVSLLRTLDAETALSHSIQVQARSTDGSVSTQRFTVSVQDVNELPVGAIVDLDAAADEVREDAAIGTAVGFQARATDADVSNNVVTYTLLDDADGRFAIAAGSGVVTVARALDAETATSHTVQIRATSSDGSSSTRLVTLTVLDADEFDVSAPTDVDAAADTVRDIDAVGTAVGITASASDADQSLPPITYTLADDAAGRFTIDASTGVVRLQRSVAADVGTAQTLVVQTTSADGSTATRSFSVAITRANLFAPVLTSDGGGATAALSVAENGTAVTTLVATDADVSPLPLTYALVGGADQARFALDANSGVLRFRAAPDAEAPGDADANQVYDVVVQVSDGLRTDTQTLAVTVTDVNEFALGPLTDTDAAADTVPENAEIGTPVGVRLQATDADATNNAVTYALLDSAGGRFAIDASTGVVTVAAPLDAETAQQHTLVVRATSSDRSLWTQAFMVAVTDVDEFDLVAIGDGNTAQDTVAEDAPVGTDTGLRAQAVDADVTANAVTYALADDAGGRFAIDASTGILTVAAALDAETALGHTVVVRATSADGSVWTQAFAVAVTDVDEFDLSAIGDVDTAPDTVAEDAPVGTATGLRARAVDADATANVVTYTLVDDARGRFAVDASTGVVTVAAALDAESALGHTVLVRATSADGSSRTQSFTVAVRDVDEFDLQALADADAGANEVLETAPIGTAVGIQGWAVDGDIRDNAVTYALDDSDGGRFAVDAQSGVVTLARSVHEEGVASRSLVLRATSADGSTVTRAFTVAVTAVNDAVPVITSDGGGATAVLARPEGGDLRVTQVRATDADLPADTLRYTRAGGADAALFQLEADTGLLQWRAAPDHETPRDANGDGVYEVWVRVSDGVHAAVQALSVVVDNVDEAPQWVAHTLAVSEGGVASPVLLARDVDTPAARLVYTVQDLTGGRFEQVTAPGTGLLRFTQAEVDAGAIRFVADGGEAAPFYRLVLADDRNTLAAQPVTVAFTPVNDAPVVNRVDLGTLDEDTSRVFTAAELLAGATDAEGDPLTVSGLQLVAGAGTLTDLGDGRWRFDPAADWQGAVTLSGRVDDGQLGTALVASLQVQPVNDAPRIVSGDGVATLALAHAENATRVTTVVGADVEADTPLRYAVVGGADAARFQIDAATGVLSFRQAPDREQPADADADHRYDVTVQVSDGALTAQQALQITVTNVDEAPVVTRNVLLLTDGGVTLVLQARDPDTLPTALTYRVDAAEGGQFERASAPGQAVQVFTQAELDAAEVRWVAPVDSTSARYALRLSDGVSEVSVGSPGLERQSATRTVQEMAPVVSLSGERPSATTDDPASDTSTPEAAASARRSALLQASSTGNAGDAALGLGQGAADSPGAGRSSGTKAAEVGAAVSRSVAARGGPPPVAERAELALELPSDAAEPARRLVTELDLWSKGSGTSLAEQLDRLRQEVADAQQAGMVSLASTALVSTGLSVGYVVWLVRGGVLMTSLMSVVPAWAGLDPLPVLSEIRRAEGGGAATDGTDEDEAGGGDDDPIEKLFSKARRLLVRPTAGSADAPGLPETPA